MVLRIFFMLLFLFTTALDASEDTKIATYDRSVVTQSNAYYNIYLLSANAKTMEILKELNQKIKDTLEKLLVTEDETLLRELQSNLRSYEKKKSTVKKVLQSSRYKKKKVALDNFLESHYTKEYDAIIPTKLLYGSSYQGKVILNVHKVDITKRVIADIEKAIENLD